jgi:hypothetical protein
MWMFYRKAYSCYYTAFLPLILPDPEVIDFDHQYRARQAFSLCNMTMLLSNSSLIVLVHVYWNAIRKHYEIKRNTFSFLLLIWDILIS